MTLECISSSLTHICFSGLPSPHHPPIVERTDQQKANIWVPNLWNPRKFIGELLCRNFYLPLYKPLSGSQKEQMNKEIVFCDEFLDKSKRIHRKHFTCQQEIRHRFALNKINYQININDTKLVVTCPVLKVNSSADKDPFKVVFLGGNLTTGSNTLWYYPWAAALYEIFKDHDLPPSELYLFSIYEVRTLQGKKYKFDDLATIAHFTAELLKQIGKSNIYIAHSIGTMLLLLAAERVALETLTKHICLDRGLSSVEAMSKNFFHGRFSFALARFSGWDADLVPAICKLADKVTITVCGAIHDQVFKRNANYLYDPRIQNLAKTKKIRIAGFDLPLAIANNLYALHSFRLDLVTDLYLKDEHTNFKLDAEDYDLAKQIIHDALRSDPVDVPLQMSSKKDEEKNDT